MAEYPAPFVPGNALADAAGNVWLHLTPWTPVSREPGTFYDVIDREGALIDRVLIPPSFCIMGFGVGVVYLTSREGTGTVLLRARIR